VGSATGSSRAEGLFTWLVMVATLLTWASGAYLLWVALGDCRDYLDELLTMVLVEDAITEVLVWVGSFGLGTFFAVIVWRRFRQERGWRFWLVLGLPALLAASWAFPSMWVIEHIRNMGEGVCTAPGSQVLFDFYAIGWVLSSVGWMLVLVHILVRSAERRSRARERNARKPD
jgi:hypothetical protein